MIICSWRRAAMRTVEATCPVPENFHPRPGLAAQTLSYCFMARRNSPNDIRQLADLNQLSEIVVDKRLSKRAEAKKSRRNRHYEKQFIKNALTAGLDDDES